FRAGSCIGRTLATSHLPMRKPPTLGTTHLRPLRMTLPGPAVLQQARAIRPQPRLVPNLPPRSTALTHLARQGSAAWTGRSAVLTCSSVIFPIRVFLREILTQRWTTRVPRTFAPIPEFVAHSLVVVRQAGNAAFGWTGTRTWLERRGLLPL